MMSGTISYKLRHKVTGKFAVDWCWKGVKKFTHIELTYSEDGNYFPLSYIKFLIERAVIHKSLYVFDEVEIVGFRYKEMRTKVTTKKICDEVTGKMVFNKLKIG